MLPDKNDLEIYVHIPFCKSKCKYCDFVSSPASDSEIDAYVEALCDEIRSVKEEFKTYKITSIYFGGGTPSLLSIDKFKKIVEALEKSFNLFRQYKDKGAFSLDAKTSKTAFGYYLGSEKRSLKDQVEFSVECNPDTVDLKKFKEYKKLGVNRISFGLQSNNNRDLSLLGRTYNVDDFSKAYFAARDAGFENINIDLIHSIPGQNTLEFMKSLYGVMMLGPEHLSIYSLTLEEGTPLYRQTSTGADGRRIYKDEGGNIIPYPSEEEDREMYHTASDFLRKAGFSRYEISNFAKEGMECRHNKGYWRRQNYIGFGISAASMIDNVRWKNTSDINKYIEAFRAEDDTSKTLEKIREEKEVLSVNDQMSEFVFLGLRMEQGISKEEFIEAFGVDFDFKYGDITRKFIDEGLMEEKEFEYYDPVNKRDYVKTRVYLTDEGVDVSNRIMAEYMPDK